MKTDLTLRTGLGRSLSFPECDANLQRLMYWSGLWQAGTYEANEVVFDLENLWIANKQTSQVPLYIEGDPPTTSEDWDLLGRSIVGYGEAEANTPLAFPDLGLAWQTLPIDTVMIDGPVVTFDIGANTFQFDHRGLWDAQIIISFQHDNSQSGRTTELRVVLASDSTVVGRIAFGIGRNVTDTLVNVNAWLNVLTQFVNQPLRWEIGGGSAITDVVFTTLIMRLQRID